MYESVLTSYQGAFPSGTSREDVETYLASKTLHFERRCLAISEHTACDIVEIGTEPSPWYCSRSVVCLEFHFSTGTNDALRSDSSERLESIALVRKLEDCL